MIANRRQPSNNNASVFSKVLLSIVKVTFLLLLCGTSYLTGSLNGHQSTLDYTALVGNEDASVGRLIHGEKISSDTPSDCTKVEEEFIELQVKKELEEHRKKLLSERSDGNDSQQQHKQQSRRFPSKSMSKFINGISRVKKDDLNDFFDFGNPIEQGKSTGQEDSIILYQNKEAYPTDSALKSSVEYDDGNGIPLTDTKSATENCDAMNVIFTDNPGNTRQCTAIVGNFESYHIQRFMKVDTVTSSKVQSDLPLKLVSRGYASRGKANFYSPPSDSKFSPVKRHWTMLKTFLQNNVDNVLEDLRPILDKVARDNSVVIMTCNMGQAALLMNFACSAKRRGFDLGNVLVFPSDVETRDLVEGLGLTTYYDEKVCDVCSLCVPFDCYKSSIQLLHLWFIKLIKEYGPATEWRSKTIRR